MAEIPEDKAKEVYRSLSKSLNVTGSASSRKEPESRAEPSPASKRLMGNLWLLMTSMYGHKWTSVHGLEDSDGLWSKALSGIGGEQIAKGMQACLEQKLEWPPSAPQFRAMCEAAPADYGLPTEDQAYKEACNNAHPNMAGIAKWTHDAIYHAACETGFYNLNTLKDKDSRKLFARNYAIAVRMVMGGEKLKTIPLALPEKVEARSTPEVGKSALANLRKKLRGQDDE